MTIHSIHSIRILTIGGTQLWEEADNLDIDCDILESNDIYRKGPIHVINNLRLCEVDTERTAIADFYKWNELPVQDHDTFCWRNMYHIVGDRGDSWLDIPTKEKLGTIPMSHVMNAILQSNKNGITNVI